MHGGVNCEAMQRVIRERRALAGNEFAHIDKCESCMEMWLTAALEEKPEVAIPADFAVQVAAKLPARSAQRLEPRRPRHWGVISAMALVTVLLVVCFASPAPPNSWIETAFVLLVATEIAGLALWLGPNWTSR